MPYLRNRQAGLFVALLLGASLFGATASGQDAAWEGLINAGRNALQQQNFSEAERHFEAALEQAERFPSGDARLGKSYNNLAAVYYAQEDFERAEPLMRRALAQLRETLGPENTEVAQTMKNLAALYYLRGNRKEAEVLLKQSLEILESVHGPNHAFVATVLSNLAGLYQAENRYRDAEPLLSRSLTIWESLLGSDHPDVVRSRTLLADLRRGQGGSSQPASEPAAVAAPADAAAPTLAAAPTASGEDAAVAIGSNSNTVAERDQAKTALEQLTELSRAEAAAGGVPVPALSPIAALDAAITADDGAAGDVATELDAVAAEDDEALRPPAADGGDAPAADGPVSPEPVASPDPVSRPAVTSPLAEPLPPAQTQGQAVAAAILNDAASANDVSYAIYLSTLWSIDEARRYWRAMQTAMPDILQDKSLELEAVAAGDGSDPFYRVLTAPFSSDPEAQQACEKIKSQLRTHDCSVVVRGPTADG